MMYYYKFSPAKISDAMAALQLVKAVDIAADDCESAIEVTFTANLSETEKRILAFYGELSR